MSSRAAPRNPIAPAPIPTAQDGTPAIPPYAGPDVINVINASGNVQTDDGAQTIIDILPDMRFPLLSWIYSIQHAIPVSAYSASPHASPSSMLAYTIIMYTGLLFFNDISLRPSPSLDAQQIFNDHATMMFFNTLLDLPIPAFAVNEFIANQYFVDPLASNLFFSPNLASANFLYDFGRLFPASIFIRLHNLMAQLPANTTPQSLLRDFYALNVAQINFGTAGQPNNINVTPRMFFGASIGDSRYSNWLNQRVERLVTALAIRPVFTAPTIGPLPLNEPTIADNAIFNGYTFLTGFRHSNLNTLLQFVRSLGQFVKDTFPASQPLRNYCQPGTSEAVRYLTFRSPIPTWTTSGDRPTSDANALAMFAATAVSSSHDTFATDTNWLIAAPDPTTAPDGTNHSRNGHRLRAAAQAPGHPFSWQATMHLAPPAGTPDPLQYVENTEEQSNSTPRCLIFDPTDSATPALSRVILSGHVFEYNDVSSASTLVARPDLTLHTVNASLISGALPIPLLTNAINHGSGHVVQALPVYTHLTLPQQITRGPPGPARLGFIRQGIICVIRSAASATVNMFNSATWVLHSRYPHLTWNIFGLHLGQTTTLEPSVITFWSSYRYFDVVANRWMALPGLRNIYGTRARHFGSEHPAIRIP